MLVREVNLVLGEHESVEEKFIGREKIMMRKRGFGIIQNSNSGELGLLHCLLPSKHGVRN